MQFVDLLSQRAHAPPAGSLHLAMHNVAMHDVRVVRTWLAAHPLVQVLWLPRYAAQEETTAERR